MLATLAVVSVLGVFDHHPAAGGLPVQPDQRVAGHGPVQQASPRQSSCGQEYSLDQPLWKQYLIWAGFPAGTPWVCRATCRVSSAGRLSLTSQWLIWWAGALWMTVLVNLAAVLFIYAVALTAWHSGGGEVQDLGRLYLGLSSAILGLATPNFLLALILFYYGNRYLNLPIGGLMDPQYEGQPMSFDKMKSVLIHLIIPTFVIGTSGAAAMMQRLRANLLDELGKPYVETARAKGMSEPRMLTKYPLRVAFNPFVADIGTLLPSLGVWLGSGVGGAWFADHWAAVAFGA